MRGVRQREAAGVTTDQEGNDARRPGMSDAVKGALAGDDQWPLWEVFVPAAEGGTIRARGKRTRGGRRERACRTRATSTRAGERR